MNPIVIMTLYCFVLFLGVYAFAEYPPKNLTRRGIRAFSISVGAMTGIVTFACLSAQIGWKYGA